MKITIEIPDHSLPKLKFEQSQTAMRNLPIERYLSACCAIGATIIGASNGNPSVSAMHDEIANMTEAG